MLCRSEPRFDYGGSPLFFGLVGSASLSLSIPICNRHRNRPQLTSSRRAPSVFWLSPFFWRSLLFVPEFKTEVALSCASALNGHAPPFAAPGRVVVLCFLSPSPLQRGNSTGVLLLSAKIKARPSSLDGHVALRQFQGELPGCFSLSLSPRGCRVTRGEFECAHPHPSALKERARLIAVVAFSFLHVPLRWSNAVFTSH